MINYEGVCSNFVWMCSTKAPRKCFSDTGRTRENVIKIVLIFICHWAKFSPTFCVSFPPSPCSNLIHFSASCAQRWSGKFRPPRVLTLPKMLFRLTLRNDHLNAGGNRALFRKSFEWMVGLCNFVSCLIDDEMGFWQVCLEFWILGRFRVLRASAKSIKM